MDSVEGNRTWRAPAAPIPQIKSQPAEAPRPVRSTPVDPAKVEEAKPMDAEKAKKRQNALTRTLWTFIMIGGFLSMSFSHYSHDELTNS